MTVLVLVNLGFWVCATLALAAANHFLIHPDRPFVDALQNAAVICAMATVFAFVLTRLSSRMKRTDRPGR